jgi:hypothetical protein
MMKNAFMLLILAFFVAGCGPQDQEAQEQFQPRNPKSADVQIHGDVVTVKIPASDPYFRLEKVKDDSVPYTEISFKYDGVKKTFLYKTDLQDWQPVPADENPIEMGQVSIAIEGQDITLAYPSGTWAFP